MFHSENRRESLQCIALHEARQICSNLITSPHPSSAAPKLNQSLCTQYTGDHLAPTPW